MAVSTAAAIIGAAVIGAGSAYYSGEQQKDAAEDAADKQEAGRLADEKKRDEAAAAAKAEQDRINRETKPEDESLQEIQFGVDGSGSTGSGSSSDFLVPKTSALGSSGSGRSGLGFKV